MNPAWPMENWPVKPFTTLSETARMTLMPATIAMNVQEIDRTCSTPRSSGTAMMNGRNDRRNSLSELTLDLLRAELAEQAGRAHEQDDDEEREGDAVAVGRERVPRDVLLGEAEREAAHHGAGHVADAAEDRGDEGLEAERQAHERVHLRARAGEEQRGGGGEGAPEREGVGDDAVHVDAHEPGHLRVERHGAHRGAELRPVDDVLQHEHEQHRDHERDDVVVRDVDAERL